MKIDAHQHFWTFNPTEYRWIDETMPQLRRDFLPKHLRELLDAVGIDGSIAVQARQSTEETAWLLELAQWEDRIRGVVGWVELVADSVQCDLEHFAANPLLKGLRHVVQDEPNDDFLLRDDFNRGVSLLEEFDLTYDILIFERHLPQAIAFVDRHPNQVFVLDHIAKPRIRDGIHQPWKQNITALAERPNVYCKLSGLVTEANITRLSYDALIPYMETVLDAFSPHRLMFGSDWPVCTLACEYATWATWVQNFIAQLSSAEQARIFGLTAVEAYRL